MERKVKMWKCLLLGVCSVGIMYYLFNVYSDSQYTSLVRAVLVLKVSFLVLLATWSVIRLACLLIVYADCPMWIRYIGCLFYLLVGCNMYLIYVVVFLILFTECLDFFVTNF